MRPPRSPNTWRPRPEPSRDNYFSRVADLANRRRPLVCEHPPRAGGITSLTGCTTRGGAGASRFGPVDFIGVTASDEPLSLIKELKNQGITVAFARVRDVVRDDTRLAGIEAIVRSLNLL